MPSVFSAFASALSARLPLMAAALWWSSGICLGFVAVPLVFQHAGSVALAARITPHLFAAQTWLALGCGAVLLLTRPREPQRQDTALISLTTLGMLLALLVQHAAAPRIAARINLPLWHTAGTLLYAGQWLCATVLLWRLARH